VPSVWPSSVIAELGDPTTSTDVALCVYDAGGLAIATGMRAGSGWTSRGAAGFRHRDPAGMPGGITQAKLVAGAGTKGSLSLKGKGMRLPSLGLPLAVPVTAQLVTSSGATCWEGTYPSASKSTATLFKAKD
jgi:hypothetical protein